MRGYTSPSPRPAFSKNPIPMGPETVTSETWGSFHTDLSLSLSAITPFQPLPKQMGSEQGAPWQTSSGKGTMPDPCVKGNTMHLEITCFQEIQNNLLKVMLALADFSFRVTCLY